MQTYPGDDRQDPYEILGLPYDADDAMIQQAFRKAALESHPYLEARDDNDKDAQKDAYSSVLAKSSKSIMEMLSSTSTEFNANTKCHLPGTPTAAATHKSQFHHRYTRLLSAYEVLKDPGARADWLQSNSWRVQVQQNPVQTKQSVVPSEVKSAAPPRKGLSKTPSAATCTPPPPPIVSPLRRKRRHSTHENRSRRTGTISTTMTKTRSLRQLTTPRGSSRRRMSSSVHERQTSESKPETKEAPPPPPPLLDDDDDDSSEIPIQKISSSTRHGSSTSNYINPRNHKMLGRSSNSPRVRRSSAAAATRGSSPIRSSSSARESQTNMPMLETKELLLPPPPPLLGEDCPDTPIQRKSVTSTRTRRRSNSGNYSSSPRNPQHTVLGRSSNSPRVRRSSAATVATSNRRSSSPRKSSSQRRLSSTDKGSSSSNRRRSSSPNKKPSPQQQQQFGGSGRLVRSPTTKTRDPAHCCKENNGVPSVILSPPPSAMADHHQSSGRPTHGVAERQNHHRHGHHQPKKEQQQHRDSLKPRRESFSPSKNKKEKPARHTVAQEPSSSTHTSPRTYKATLHRKTMAAVVTTIPDPDAPLLTSMSTHGASVAPAALPSLPSDFTRPITLSSFRPARYSGRSSSARSPSPRGKSRAAFSPRIAASSTATVLPQAPLVPAWNAWTKSQSCSALQVSLHELQEEEPEQVEVILATKPIGSLHASWPRLPPEDETDNDTWACPSIEPSTVDPPNHNSNKMIPPPPSLPIRQPNPESKLSSYLSTNTKDKATPIDNTLTLPAPFCQQATSEIDQLSSLKNTHHSDRAASMRQLPAQVTKNPRSPLWNPRHSPPTKAQSCSALLIDASHNTAKPSDHYGNESSDYEPSDHKHLSLGSTHGTPMLSSFLSQQTTGAPAAAAVEESVQVSEEGISTSTRIARTLVQWASIGGGKGGLSGNDNISKKEKKTNKKELQNENTKRKSNPEKGSKKNPEESDGTDVTNPQWTPRPRAASSSPVQWLRKKRINVDGSFRRRPSKTLQEQEQEKRVGILSFLFSRKQEHHTNPPDTATAPTPLGESSTTIGLSSFLVGSASVSASASCRETSPHQRQRRRTPSIVKRINPDGSVSEFHHGSVSDFNQSATTMNTSVVSSSECHKSATTSSTTTASNSSHSSFNVLRSNMDENLHEVRDKSVAAPLLSTTAAVLSISNTTNNRSVASCAFRNDKKSDVKSCFPKGGGPELVVGATTPRLSSPRRRRSPIRRCTIQLLDEYHDAVMMFPHQQHQQ